MLIIWNMIVFNLLFIPGITANKQLTGETSVIRRGPAETEASAQSPFQG